MLGLITRMDLVKWLCSNLDSDSFPSELKCLKIRNFRRSGRQEALLTALHTARVIEALMTFYENNVSGLPIVDEEGNLQGTITASDLMHLQLSPEDDPRTVLKKLLMPIRQQLKSPSAAELITCGLEDTLQALIPKFVQHCVHRVWIVSEDNRKKPIGVVSLCDVIAQFVGQPTTTSYIK